MAADVRSILVDEMKKRDLSREDMAEYLEISGRSLASYVLGYRRPELNNLEAILNKLGYRLEIVRNEEAKIC